MVHACQWCKDPMLLIATGVYICPYCDMQPLHPASVTDESA